MPRFSAVSITTLGLSTWQVTTSIPWSARLLTDSASLTGSTQSPVKITWVVAFGLTVRAPRVKELMLRRDAGYRSEEHTSELQSHHDLVCRLLLEKKKKHHQQHRTETRTRSTAVRPA